MKKEKIILLAVAGLIGLFITIAVFFLYQETRKVNPSEIKKITIKNPTPQPQSSIFISVNSPKDEEVVDKRNIVISGKTIPEAKILIISENSQELALASGIGDFSADLTIDEGENILEIIAIAPNGETAKTKKVVTFSTEIF